MMKKFLSILFLLGCLAAHAQNTPQAQLRKMTSTIKGWKSYRVDFALKTDPSAASITGSYTVSGQQYRFTVQDRELISDGKLRWEINSADREVSIDKVDPKARGILSNPTAVFDFPEEYFEVQSQGRRDWKGRPCEVLSLSPREKGQGMEQATLMLDAGSGLPAGIVYRLENVSEPVEVQVTSIKSIPAPADGEFRFDKAKYKGYEIIDFR